MQDTRTRILVTSLLLFNEHGEPKTTTNAIADAVDISPGNLHYHFRKKADLVEALLLEFQADVRRLLQPQPSSDMTLDTFWEFLYSLVEVLAAYRFLLRDMETLISTYPKVSPALKGFSRGLLAMVQLHIDHLRRDKILEIEDSAVSTACRNLVIVAMFSERFDNVAGIHSAPDATALRIARSVLALLASYSTSDAEPLLRAMAEHYKS